MDGVGLTVIVNVVEAPVQVAPALVYDGVTTIVAVTGAMPAFVATNDGIFPDPDAANPIEGVLFVQLNTVPGTEPLKLTAAVLVLLQTVWFETAFTFGIGFTV